VFLNKKWRVLVVLSTVFGGKSISSFLASIAVPVAADQSLE